MFKNLFQKVFILTPIYFLIVCIQPGVTLNLLLIFDNLNLTILKKCVLIKKSVYVFEK